MVGNQEISEELNVLLARLDVDFSSGLSMHEAGRRLQEAGPNELAKQKTYSALRVLFAQFRNSIVLLLLAASVISWFFGDPIETIAILLVILINAVIGFLLEMQAHRSMESLRKMDRQEARVVRDGRIIQIDIRQVVPGDILFMEAGDYIAADAIIGSSVSLEVNESLLTGESVPVPKSGKVPEAGEESSNLIYRGTFVTKGNARALVTSTGMSTEMGRISSMVIQADKGEIPLNRRLNQLSRRLIWLTLGIILVFIILGLQSDRSLYQMIETGIALAVAAIPEGLPVVATIALAHGMLRMSKKKVLVKKLAAVETLGETDLIMTDKTGTLTENRLEVMEVFIPGHPYNEKNYQDESYTNLILTALLCNNASGGNHEPAAGDPLEVALLEFADKWRPDLLTARSEWEKTGEQPFESDTRVMVTHHRRQEVSRQSLKGAPSEVLAQCTRVDPHGLELTQAMREEWLNKAAELAARGYKVLGFGQGGEEGQYSFSGLVALSDPPRDEVPDAVRRCHEAGIEVVMVTGDHPATALAIARETGIVGPEEEQVVTGKDLNMEELTGIRVFSRVSPKQKMEILSAYQAKGLVVAMTGDGVNDAPALRKSDIGIAMGLRGTQVAREASDMVLQNDSFGSIVHAIREGRTIFNNIRHFVIYLISCNLSEILTVSAGAIVAMKLPLLPLQILFLNLVTDVFPALALGMGGESAALMHGKFRTSGNALLDKGQWRIIAMYAAILTLSVLSAYFYSIHQLHVSAEEANNIAFYTLAFSQLMHPLSLIRGNQSFFRNEIVRNRHLWMAIVFCAVLVISMQFIPGARSALGLVPISSGGVWVIVLGSILPVPVIRTIKLLHARISGG